MSHHGRKHRKHRQGRQGRARVVCARCAAPQDGSAAALLAGVAAALNVCADAGVTVKLRHGIVVAREGYVFPLLGGRWAARTLTVDPLTPAASGDLDDD